jgi:hypothetical protein
MGQLTIGGNLTAGPPQGVNTGFPGIRATIPLTFLQGSEGIGYSVATGILQRTLNSPSAFAELQGVGADDTVTHGSFLYFKSGSDVIVRVTTDDGNGGDVEAEIPINGGPLIIPFQSGKFLKALAAKGSGVLEYFVCGLI